MKKTTAKQSTPLGRRWSPTSGPLLVHFRTAWSGQCRVLAPSLEVLAGKLKGRLKTVDVNLDDHPELAQQFAITQVPTLVLFDHAAPIERFTGLMSPQELSVRLRGVLADYSMPPRVGTTHASNLPN